MASCPHCSENIESLSGFVPQATLEARLKAKSDETKLIADALKEAKVKASGYDAIVMERDTLKGEITKRDEHSTRTTAMTEAGLDPSLLASVETLYASAIIGQDEPQSLADWLSGDAKEHPLLADRFGKPPGDQPPANPLDPTKPNLNVIPTAPGPNLNPQAPTGQDPPPPGGKISGGDIQRYFASAEYNALPPAEKRVKMQEVQASWNAQENA